MQRLTYVPAPVHYSSYRQPIQQQIDRMNDIKQNQINSYRNISITRGNSEYHNNSQRRGSLQVKSCDNSRKSVDYSSCQRKYITSSLQKIVQPVQLPIHSIQQRESSKDQQGKNQQQYFYYQQNSTFDQNIQSRNSIFVNSQNGNIQNQQQDTSSILFSQSQPQQPNQLQNNSLTKIQPMTSSSNIHVESEKQQLTKIAANYKEINTIKDKILIKRHSIDSVYQSVDQKLGLDQLNSQVVLKNNSSYSKCHEAAKAVISTNGVAAVPFYKSNIPKLVKKPSIYQYHKDRYQNTSMNGSFIHNSSMNQLQDAINTLNTSTNIYQYNDIQHKTLNTEQSKSKETYFIKTNETNLPDLNEVNLTKPQNTLVDYLEDQQNENLIKSNDFNHLEMNDFHFLKSHQMSQSDIYSKFNDSNQFKNHQFKSTNLSNQNLNKVKQTLSTNVQLDKLIEANHNKQKDVYNLRPRCFSQSSYTRQIQDQTLQPSLIMHQNPQQVHINIQQHIQKNQKNQIQEKDTAFNIYTSENPNNQATSKTNILSNNINQQNKSINLMSQYQTTIQKKQLNLISVQPQNSSDYRLYLSELIKKKTINTQNQSSNKNILLKIPSENNDNIKSNNSILIQSIELQNSVTKKQLDKSDQIEIRINGNTNNDCKEALKNDQTGLQEFQIIEKDNVLQQNPPQTMKLYNSSVTDEYDEKYKQDRIPISHTQTYKPRLSFQNAETQAILSLLNEDDSKQMPLRQQQQQINYPIQQSQSQNLQNDKYQINVIQNTNESNNCHQSLFLNDTKLNQNTNTTFNNSDDVYQLSISNIGTPITVQQLQNYQRIDQNEYIQLFDNYQSSDNIFMIEKNLKKTKPDDEKDKAIEEEQKSNNMNQYHRLPPPPEQNLKNILFHKKNVCKNTDQFLFNKNSFSPLLDSYEDINQIASQRKTCFSNNNDYLIPISPIDQIRRNQHDVFEISEIPSPLRYPQHETLIVLQNNQNQKEQIDSSDELENSHLRYMNNYKKQQKEKMKQNQISEIKQNEEYSYRKQHRSKGDNPKIPNVSILQNSNSQNIEKNQKSQDSNLYEKQSSSNKFDMHTLNIINCQKEKYEHNHKTIQDMVYQQNEKTISILKKYEQKQQNIQDNINKSEVKPMSLFNKSIETGNTKQRYQILDQNQEYMQVKVIEEVSGNTKQQQALINEKIIEDYAEALYTQLNIERSLLQLKTGLGRKMTKLEQILPQDLTIINQNEGDIQQGETLSQYKNRLNIILGTQYTEEELMFIFQNSRIKNNDVDNIEETNTKQTTQSDVNYQVKQQLDSNSSISQLKFKLKSQIKTSLNVYISKQDVLEVLLGIQSLQLTQNSSQICEETKKIIRNILKETLKAENNFRQLRQRFQRYQQEIFRYISKGNKDIVTYSDFKSFFIQNGYQVRDQEMMLLIYRFHKPNSIKLSYQQFLLLN